MDRPHVWSLPLPFELYRTIIENFVDDLQSLCSMCVTCTMLQREAERVLYRRITESFDVWSSIEATKERQERLLFNAILGPNSRLALLVETYALGGLSDYGEEPFWSLLRDGLRAMTNLKWLSIRLSKGRTGTELLDGCSFRLLGLDLGYDSKSSVITFLPLQPDLLHLDVSWSAPAALNTNQSQSQTLDPDLEIRPPSAVCEKLRLLRGNGRTIQELLPGRSKVASLAYRPSQRESIASAAVILRSLSTELGRIRCLLFGGAYRRPGLEIIVDCLQSLEVLHLVTSPDTTEELDLLPRLAKLRLLTLSSASEFGSTPSILREGQGDIIINLFVSCGKLETINVQVFNSLNYSRWNRGQNVPVASRAKDINVYWEVVAFHPNAHGKKYF